MKLGLKFWIAKLWNPISTLRWYRRADTGTATQRLLHSGAAGGHARRPPDRTPWPTMTLASAHGAFYNLSRLTPAVRVKVARL